MTKLDRKFISSSFSKDLVIISGEITIKSTFAVAKNQNTVYLIVSTKQGNTHSRYVIPTFLFIAAAEKLLPSPFSSISSFLKLNESNADRSITIAGDPLTDPETEHILSQVFPLDYYDYSKRLEEDFLILLHDNEVIGVIDSRRDITLSRRNYTLKGLEITMRPSTWSMEPFDALNYHYDFTNRLKEMASLYLSQGDRLIAEIYYHKLLDMYRDKFGGNHPYVVMSMISLADLYYSHNDDNEAINFYRQAWTIVKKNISRWQSTDDLDSNIEYRLMAINGILRKLAEMLNKLGVDSTSRDIYLMIFFVESQIKKLEEINKKHIKKLEEFESELAELEQKRAKLEQNGMRGYDVQRMHAYDPPALPPPDYLHLLGIPPVSDDEPSEIVLYRYPSVKYPATLPIGETANLIISISIQPLSTSRDPLTIIASKSKQHVPIVVSVVLIEPNILELIGDENAVIHVPIKSIDSKPIEFSVRAKREGYQTIILQFYNPQHQMYVGESIIKIHVVATRIVQDSDRYKSQDIQFLSTLSSDQISSDVVTTADLTLEIRENKRYGQYQFDFYLLSSNINNEYYPRKYIASLPLRREPEKEIRAIIHDIEEMIRYPLDLEESLSKKGYNLYENLFPKEVKDKYWEIKDKIKSIHLFSNEPWIPWEILKPWKGTEGGEYFLCEQYSFTRWPIRHYNNNNYYKYYKPIAHAFQIKKVEVIAPSDTKLTNALQESEFISKFGEREGFSVRVNKTVDDLMNILDSGFFDLLHISAHGKYDSDEPLLSHISIEEGRADFRAESIVGPNITRTFSQTNPIVFLNTCQSGSQGYSLTGV